jgi:hypothetical protein
MKSRISHGSEDESRIGEVMRGEVNYDLCG